MNGQTTPTGNELYQLLVDGSTAAYIVEEWDAQHYPFDLRIRRAKTRGKVVIELTNTLFASRIVQWYGAKVNIKQNV